MGDGRSSTTTNDSFLYFPRTAPVSSSTAASFISIKINEDADYNSIIDCTTIDSMTYSLESAINNNRDRQQRKVAKGKDRLVRITESFQHFLSSVSLSTAVEEILEKRRKMNRTKNSVGTPLCCSCMSSLKYVDL